MLVIGSCICVEMARLGLSLKKRRNLQRTQLIMLIINIVALLYEIWIKTINNNIRSIRSKEKKTDKKKDCVLN